MRLMSRYFLCCIVMLFSTYTLVVCSEKYAELTTMTLMYTLKILDKKNFGFNQHHGFSPCIQGPIAYNESGDTLCIVANQLHSGTDMIYLGRQYPHYPILNAILPQSILETIGHYYTASYDLHTWHHFPGAYADFSTQPLLTNSFPLPPPCYTFISPAHMICWKRNTCYLFVQLHECYNQYRDTCNIRSLYLVSGTPTKAPHLHPRSEAATGHAVGLLPDGSYALLAEDKDKKQNQESLHYAIEIYTAENELRQRIPVSAQRSLYERCLTEWSKIAFCQNSRFLALLHDTTIEIRDMEKPNEHIALLTDIHTKKYKRQARAIALYSQKSVLTLAVLFHNRRVCIYHGTSFETPPYVLQPHAYQTALPTRASIKFSANGDYIITHAHWHILDMYNLRLKRHIGSLDMKSNIVSYDLSSQDEVAVLTWEGDLKVFSIQSS